MTVEEASLQDRKCRCFSTRARGIIATLLGAFSLAVAALLVKVCATALSTLDLLWGRAILQTTGLGLFFLIRCESPWGPRGLRLWLCLRGILGCLAVVGYFMGIIALPLSDSISIYSVKPICAALLGACILGERLTWMHALATGLSLLGCILVAKEEHHDAKSKHSSELYLDPVVAVILLLLAALFAAGTMITTRKVMAGTALRPEVPVWYFCFMDLLLLGAATPLLWGTSFTHRAADIGWTHLASLAGVAGCSVLGQQFFTYGLRYIPSALGTLLLQMETVDAFVLQVIFLAKVGPMSILGALLICTASASLAIFELRSSSRDSDNEDGESGESLNAETTDRSSVSSERDLVNLAAVDLESRPVGHATDPDHLN